MSRRSLPPLLDRVTHLAEAARGKRVLHLGCTDAPFTAQSIAAGRLLHDRLAEVADHLVGVDTDSDGLQLLRDRGHRDLIASPGRLRDAADAIDDAGPFEVIVAAEVVEHVDDPGTFLADIAELAGPSGAEVVLTTINAYGALRFVQYAWPRRGPLSEPVHPDHVAYYSLSTLGLACRRAGLRVTSQAFYDLGPEHRAAMPRRQRAVNDVAVARFPQLADGIVVHATVDPV